MKISSHRCSRLLVACTLILILPVVATVMAGTEASLQFLMPGAKLGDTVQPAPGGKGGVERPFRVASSNSGADDHGRASRPAYNTGNGFFVRDGRLYDANGNEFRIRGVNRVHWDSSSAAGIAKSGANTVRWGIDFSRAAADNVNLVRSQSIENSNIPIVGNWRGTCKNDPSVLQAIVATWVAQAPEWTKLNKYLIVNVANEWGPSDSTIWRDTYVDAIRSLRGAGYLGTILVDTGGCGQDIQDLLNYSSAVFNADPQKNVIFSLHVYGRIPTSDVGPYLARLAALRNSEGIPFLVGEFGPGRSIGPSATLTTPADVITAAEANDIGWLAWAWDDNNLPHAKADDTWFSMTYAGIGVYSTAADLTVFGKDVVLNPVYGLKALAKPATVF